MSGARISAALVIAAVCAGPACRGRAPSSGSASGSLPAEPSLPLSALLSDAPGAVVVGGRGDGGGAGEGASFARALVARPFVFPDDDGPHAEFRSEWWYFTGVLRTGVLRTGAPGAGARRFGYEMTIFRQALAPRAAARASAWATRDAFMGHVAITDIDGGGGGDRDVSGGERRFHFYERFARDGLGLAGARAQPFAVWIDDWRMQGPAGGGGPLPIHLSARAADGAAIELDLGGGDGEEHGSGHPIAAGDRGLSAKGPAPGNASFYYSRPSLATRGRLTLPSAEAASPGAAAAGASFDVAGVSWMDREWGTDTGAGVQGWDWLGVHLSDGRDLMMYRLRDPQGSATPESRVALMPSRPPAGEEGRAIPYQRFTLTPIETWSSPQTGARYPVSFQLDVPEAGINLVVRPLLINQEMRLAVVYWEGAVSLAGTAGGAPITGEGYLELTGYGGGQRRR